MNNGVYNEDEYFEREAPEYSGSGLKDGDTVRCIVLDRGLSSKGLKDLDAKNEAEAELAKKQGIDPDLIAPTSKNCGIEFNVAITHILGDEPQSLWTSADGRVCEPRFNASTKISMLPPPTIHEGGWNKYTKGFLYFKKGGAIKIGALLPSAFPAKNWDTGEVDAEKEASRLLEWKTALAAYEEAPEDFAERVLRERLAALYVLIDKDTKKLRGARTGLVFEAKVKRKEGSKYFDLERFKWNKETNEWDIFGSLYSYIDDESKEFASEIIKVRDEGRKQRAEAKQQASAKEVVEVEDEMPF